MTLLTKPICESPALALTVIIVVALPFSLLLSSFVSYTMDEFLVYHGLACSTQTFSKLWNHGREGCGQYDLALLPWMTPEPVFLPLRTYPYVGSVQALFYAPLYWLWKSPYSARFFGIFLIGVQSFLLCRIFGQSLLFVMAALFLFMPYVLQHLMDVGQLSLCTTAVFFLAFLHKRWMAELLSSRSRSWFFAMLIGITNVVILLFRLNNFAYIPAYLMVQAACMNSFGLRIAWRLRLRTLVWQSASIIGLVVTGTYVWLSAIDRGGAPLYQQILNPFAMSISEESSFFARAWAHFYYDLFMYFIRPLMAAHAAHDVNIDSQAEGLALLALLVAFFIVSWFRPQGGRYRLFSFVCILACVVGIASISSVSRSWGMHHIAPVFPLAILAVFSQIPRKNLGKAQGFLLLCFAIINLKLYCGLARLGPLDQDFDRHLIDLNEEINRKFAASHFMIIGSWGMYYTKLVYGPTDQSLIYADIGDAGAIAAAKIADAQAKKPALFILHGQPPDDYWGNFAEEIEQVQTEVKAGSWGVWREVMPESVKERKRLSVQN